MTPDSTLAVTQTCPKDGVHLSRKGLKKPQSGPITGKTSGTKRSTAGTDAAPVRCVQWVDAT